MRATSCRPGLLVLMVGLLVVLSRGSAVGQEEPSAPGGVENPSAASVQPEPAPPTELPAEPTPEELVQRGMELLDAGQQAQAERAFRLALSADPDLPAAYLGLGEALRMQKQWFPALDQYKRYLGTRRGATDWRGHLGIGLIYLDMEYYRLAQPALLRAYKLAPRDESVRILLNLANAHRGLNEHEKAISCGRTALDLEPDHAITHQLLATLYTDTGTAEGFSVAIQHAQTALRLIQAEFEADPGNLQLLSQLDLLYNQVAGVYQGQIQARARELRLSGVQTIEDDPELGRQMCELARVTVRAGNIKRLTSFWRAVTIAENACRVAPERSDAWFQLGQIQNLVRQDEQALESLEKAMALQPTDSDDIVPTMQELQAFYQHLRARIAATRPPPNEPGQPTTQLTEAP